MKKATIGCAVVSALLIAACDNNPADEKGNNAPKPGTVVAEAQMPVTDDPLNNFTYTVKVIADSSIGVYDVDVDFGPNYAHGQLTMPKGGEELKPVIKAGAAPYTFVIGFKVPGDTTFYDYYEVSSSKVNTKMGYTKAYSF